MSTTFIKLNSADSSVLGCSQAGYFTIQLGRSFTFDEDDEVFLSEAVLPFTWFNLTAENNKLTVGEKEITLTPAYYESIPVLIKALNAALKVAALTTVKISADSITIH